MEYFRFITGMIIFLCLIVSGVQMYVIQTETPKIMLVVDTVYGNAPLTVRASEESGDATIIMWEYDFGDGTPIVRDKVADHIYERPGEYTLTLTVFNDKGEKSSGIRIITVTELINPPVANFEIYPMYGDSPLIVKFTDTSTGNPDYWLWDFGDGSTSLDQNPKHQYIKPLQYTVSLLIKNGAGENTTVKPNLITVIPKSNAGAVNMQEGITQTSKTVVSVASSTGEIVFKDKTTGISVTSTTLINDMPFVPAKTTIDKTVTWDTATTNPDVSFTYSYLDNQLKETITLKKATSIKIPLKLSWESEVIPWGDTWKVIPLAATDTSRGIVIEKPYGTDANGRHINMSYKYDGKTQTLELVTDPLVIDEKPFVIAYPLVIDPTYNNNPSWTQVAAQSVPDTQIYSLTTYDDGSGTAIYGGTVGTGRLLKYNKTLGAWSQVAAQFGGQTDILSLSTYDDGSGLAIYGGSRPQGNLLKYNTTLGAWSQVAPLFGSEGAIRAQVTYDDGSGLAIYGSTGTNGYLMKYNKTLGSWSPVAGAKYGGQGSIRSLTTYDDGSGLAIYGGTVGAGLLFKYNITLGNWSQVAAKHGSEVEIWSLTTYDDGTGLAIYGGTTPNANLLKYNATGTNGWLQVAAKPGSETGILSLTTYDDGLGTAVYGGSNKAGELLKYNKTLGAWSVVAAKLGTEVGIYSLTTYDDGGLDGTLIYGGTGENGRLFKWQTFTTKPNTTFTATSTTGAPPISVQFNETSTSSGTSWVWKRNNLTFLTGETFNTTQNATQTFVTGNWSINLTSTNAGGSNLSAQVTWINVSGIPIVQWSIDKQTVRVPGTVIVNDTSLNIPTQWEYYWGDDTANSTFKNGTHKYVTRGVYQVSLTVTNTAGGNTSSKQVRVIGYDMQGFTPPTTVWDWFDYIITMIQDWFASIYIR